MVIEIKRDALVKEPIVTAIDGRLRVEPAILNSLCELPRGYMVAVNGNALDVPARKFRVIDNSSACYEFKGKAKYIEDGIALIVEDEFRVLR